VTCPRASHRERRRDRACWLTILALGLIASCGSSRDGTRQSGAGTGGVSGDGTGTAGSASAGSGGRDENGGASGTDSAASGGAAGEELAEGGSGQGGGDDGTRVSGRVVDIETRRPLPGRTVVLRNPHDPTRDAEATTDARGAFELERPSDVYEVLVIESDRSTVTILQDLSRSNPVIGHRPASPLPAASGVATVSGDVSFEASFPLSEPSDVAAVYLFTEESTDRYLMGAGGPPYGPDYLTSARFDARSLSGILFALGTFGRKDGTPSSEPAYTAATAAHAVTLSQGDTVALDVELEPTPLGLVSGSVILPSGRTLTGARQHYRFPYPEAVVPFPAADYVRTNPLTSNGDFAFELPEVNGNGASLCLAFASEGDSELRTERCDIVLGGGAPVLLELQAAPSLVSPAPGETLSPATEFAWSTFAGGVIELTVWPDVPSPETPAISLFTEATSAVIPDLAAWNVTLPADIDYHVTVTGLGPYSSVDAAVAPESLGAPIPTELRVSSSAAVVLTTAP
jgi:hypothetical protein